MLYYIDRLWSSSACVMVCDHRPVSGLYAFPARDGPVIDGRLKKEGLDVSRLHYSKKRG